MLELILLWGYMLAVNALIGIGVLHLIDKAAGRKGRPVSLPAALLAGVVTLTAYAGWFSIFSKVGILAHLLMLAACLAVAFVYRDDCLAMGKRLWKILFSWEGAFYLIFVVLTAYFSSRGVQHTDTGIYHAQAIRWYEEIGLVKGLGNLQQHFAYNSAYLGYAALFSMKWLLGQSLHGTNGFLQAFLCVWALYGLSRFGEHKNHTADGCRVGILIYAIVVAERVMSPATDFGTMYLIFWIVTQWAVLACETKQEDRTDAYSLLCVAAVSVTTFKLSAGLLVLLAVRPVISLVRQKAWKKIRLYLFCGIAVLLPFLIRNVLISGWLVYPLAAIDLFSVDWKVPVQYMQHDSDQIKVWGRCLYDVDKIDLPLREWFPVWWEAKERHEIMLLYANILAVFSGVLQILKRMIKKEKLNWELVWLQGTVLACIAGWFFTAPFIRYGLAFLLLLPLMSIGSWLEHIPMGPFRISSFFLCIAMLLCLSNYWDYYVMVDLVWGKQHLRDASYIRQQDYDKVQHESMQLGNLTVYYPAEGENTGYDKFPTVAYRGMAERTELRGTSLKDGFRAK